MQSAVTQFQTTLNHCLSITSFGHQLDISGNYALQRPEREIVTQAAFVRLYVAFEEFLEFSFGHYGMRLPGVSGNSIISFAAAPSSDHLHGMFIGTQRFVDWSTPSTVVKLAKLFFKDGEPFTTVINGAQRHLDDMKTVRNGASHVSRTTSASLESLFRRWTGQQQSGVTAYDVLMAQGIQSAGNTFMGFSEVVLAGVVNQLASP